MALIWTRNELALYFDHWLDLRLFGPYRIVFAGHSMIALFLTCFYMFRSVIAGQALFYRSSLR